MAAFAAPVPREVFDSLVSVVGYGVYVGLLAGAAHSSVGELPSTAVGVEMGGVESRSLTAEDRRRVRVGEPIGADLVRAERVSPAVVHPDVDCAGVEVDRVIWPRWEVR